MIDYSKVLTINYPGKKWSLSGDSYDGLDWLDESPKPTQTELDALWDSTQLAYNNTRIKQDRQRAYANESDPVFFKAQRGEATMQEWQAAVDAVKARFPYQD